MGSWRLSGLSSREIEGYSKLCHSFSACSYLLLVAAEDVNTDLFFLFISLKAQAEQAGCFLSWMPELCAMSWTFCLERVRKVLIDSQASPHSIPRVSIDSVPVSEHHLSLSLWTLLIPPKHWGQLSSLELDTHESRWSNPVRPYRNGMSGCMPRGQLSQRHTHIHLCALCNWAWLYDKANWFGRSNKPRVTHCNTLVTDSEGMHHLSHIPWHANR